MAGFYIPPIIEKHGCQTVLIDGIHRSYICSAAGTTMNCVHIKHIDVPLPFDLITWEGTCIVEKRPPIMERYKNLNKSYFRDLGYAAVDG